MIKGKQVLITGGRGFIGYALARRLAPSNDVVCFDSSLNGYGYTKKARQIAGDILNKEALASAIVGSQIIIHTAARVGVEEVLQDTVSTLETNYNGTANILEAALANATWPEQIVCFSTSEIFGAGANRVDEHGTPTFPDATDPRWCYSLSKLAAEHLALGYYRQYGLPITIIRPFNVFGEGRVGNHALLHFIQNALAGKDLVVYGDGSQIRAWCHIDDFCDAVLSTLGTGEAIGKAFNIGNPGNNISVRGLAEAVIKQCQSKSKIVFKPLPFTDINIRIPDITRAKEVLGFSPKITLKKGLLRTIEWVRSNK